MVWPYPGYVRKPTAVNPLEKKYRDAEEEVERNVAEYLQRRRRTKDV